MWAKEKKNQVNLEGYLNWLGLGFALQWSRVQVPSGSLETYIVINFRTRGISQDTRKLIQAPTLIKKIKKKKTKLFWAELL